MIKLPFDIDNYHREFSKYPKCLMESDGRVYGVWMIGNYYKRKNNYYGEYPYGYLRRIKALFPKRSPILHIFGGTVEKTADEHTVDINPLLSPTFCCDVHSLSQHITTQYPLIMLDPPYQKSDAEKYGYPYPNKKMVLREARKVATDDAVAVYLDISIPIFRKIDWNLLGMISLFTGTNRLVRTITLFHAN